MEFNSVVFFMLFLPIALIIHNLIGKFMPKIQNLYLLLLSFVFYLGIGVGVVKSISILIILAFINYIFAFMVVGNRYKKAILTIIIVINVCFLGYFKYTNFFIKNLNSIFDHNFNVLKIIVPVGISFFVFKAISYQVDLYRNKIDVEKNIVDYFLYLFFFPQILSGPIARYIDMKDEIKVKSKLDVDVFRYAIMRFIVGLGKKVILANSLGILVNDIWMGNPNSLPVFSAWVGAVAYTLQIYFDFSGYSDMSIGIARMFGFSIKENFNYPYVSKSITEFWRRWHISLSSWFKDYIYIPMGGE